MKKESGPQQIQTDARLARSLQQEQLAIALMQDPTAQAVIEELAALRQQELAAQDPAAQASFGHHAGHQAK
eukprot:4876656-Amphidinium_carterae.1